MTNKEVCLAFAGIAIGLLVGSIFTTTWEDFISVVGIGIIVTMLGLLIAEDI
jgi:hypothetical protein